MTSRRFVWNQWLGLSGKRNSGVKWLNSETIPTKSVLTANTLSGGVCLKLRTLSRERLAAWKTKNTIWWAFFGKTLSGKVCLTSRTVLFKINLYCVTYWTCRTASGHSQLKDTIQGRLTWHREHIGKVHFCQVHTQVRLAWHNILYTIWLCLFATKDTIP